LIVAGANHHTKAGYWESIRAAQPADLPIDFRGYVAEDAIPELFSTTSVVVLPYDSATGSSGPAHQACEYGVPIVSADLPDFRGMADDEDMAISFYKVGDAADLAKQLTTILQSQELQRHMAERNYAAGVQMTMANVVRNYLRWFELNQYKREMRRAWNLPRSRRLWWRSRFLHPDGPLHSGSITGNEDGIHDHYGLEPQRDKGHSIDFADARIWRKAEISKDHADGDGYQSRPILESDI